ncbi:MAG: adenosylmethionine decarboxylase [Alphaproteobacteria bacterium]|nr:MAG: adenosylmethionine decarboxylase [Alphaproteobacteria bacterium]
MSDATALLQLGMDLDCDSSTARTSAAAQVDLLAPAESDRKDYFIERDGVRYAGTHLIIDLWDAERLDDLAHIEATLKECVEAAGATLLHIHLHHFTPNGGVSGVAVLAESHISIHTWPEHGYAALDVFMCGAARPHAAVEVLRRAFAPERLAVDEILRGRGS